MFENHNVVCVIVPGGLFSTLNAEVEKRIRDEQGKDISLSMVGLDNLLSKPDESKQILKQSMRTIYVQHARVEKYTESFYDWNTAVEIAGDTGLPVTICQLA